VRSPGSAGLSTSADAHLARAVVGDGATSERSGQFSRAPGQDYAQVPRRSAAMRRSGGAWGPADLGLRATASAVFADRVDVACSRRRHCCGRFFLPAGSAEVDGVGAHHTWQRHANARKCFTQSPAVAVREGISRYVEAARKVTGGGRRSAQTPKPTYTGYDPAAVRVSRVKILGRGRLLSL
jgi:hypothetical protein